MKQIKITITIFYLLCATHLMAQEKLVDLANNPALQKISQSQLPKHNSNKKSSSTLFLPFLDDFSGNQILPSNALWANHYVTINPTYPVYPKTVGVATFDALNDSGNVYRYATSTSFIADSLTSLPINLTQKKSLATITPADSVYLSFFFQPSGGYGKRWAGYGNAPEEGDSLILEFASYPPDTIIVPAYNIYIPKDTLITNTDTTITYDTTYVKADFRTTTRWNKVWSSPGMTLTQFYALYHSLFKMVLIPIKDSKYFFDHFQFRFKNYASLYDNKQTGWKAGNIDQWNLDYVYLNTNRNRNDTALVDVAITQQKGSLLKEYQSVPWQHFLADSTALMSDTLSLSYYNLDITPGASHIRNVRRVFDITDMQKNTLVYQHDAQYVNLNPSEIGIYKPFIHYTFKSSEPDSATFGIRTHIETTPDINRQNDTVMYLQKFYNYYAYDDGIPEKGYGLSGVGGQVALKFTNHKTDTLRAVQIFFNHTLENENQKFFKLTIWNDQGGKPGSILYQSGYIKPMFENGNNTYHTYSLDQSISVSKGIFYVGWQQTADAYLNIGFDQDYSGSNIFYNSNVSWNPSLYTGTLMIRPVFGRKLPLGIQEKKQLSTVFNIFPNPLNEDILHLELKSENQSEKYIVNLFNTFGQLVYQTTYQETIDVSNLPAGIYFIRLNNTSSSEVIVKKLIITQ